VFWVFHLHGGATGASPSMLLVALVLRCAARLPAPLPPPSPPLCGCVPLRWRQLTNGRPPRVLMPNEMPPPPPTRGFAAYTPTPGVVNCLAEAGFLSSGFRVQGSGFNVQG